MVLTSPAPKPPLLPYHPTTTGRDCCLRRFLPPLGGGGSARAQRRKHFFFIGFFFLCFLFFATSHVVGAPGAGAIGRRLPRPPRGSVPQPRTGAARAEGLRAPLECGPRVLSSTSSSPVSSDTSFGWCSTHESPGAEFIYFTRYYYIVFGFLPAPASTRIAREKPTFSTTM